ncbi:MAG: riboflavin biosynthesis protein RibF [Oscillospiraceae bacterium]|nr:riboflavin biosynthesis protein RibF [Oscillospiraceae bacterium]
MDTTRQGYSVALGFFDGVHKGHQAVVRQAVEMAGDTLAPAVFTFRPSDHMPTRKQGSGILCTEAQKETLLRSLGIQRISAPDFEEIRGVGGEDFVRRILWKELGARALCCGEDFRFGKGAAFTVRELEALCAEMGIRLAVAPPVLDGGEPVSSTRIRAAVAAGEMETAARLLGRPFSLEFPVAHGRQLGRRLNFPTINQVFPQRFALPRFGVYAASVQWEGKLYPAVANVGVKPTVGAENPLAETYIVGFSGDLYGETVPVSLISFLRPERKFPSVELLREQIARDKAAAMEILSR